MRLLKLFLSLDLYTTPEEFIKNTSPQLLALFVQMVVCVTFIVSIVICWGAMLLLLFLYGKNC